MKACPKCQSTMTQGHAYSDYWSWRSLVGWASGGKAKSIWTGLSFRGKDTSEIAQFACDRCGFVEQYLDRGFNPQTGASMARTTTPSEAKQLEGVVEKLLERIAVLERIATDPAERISREIEDLKALPPKDDPKS